MSTQVLTICLISKLNLFHFIFHYKICLFVLNNNAIELKLMYKYKLNWYWKYWLSLIIIQADNLLWLFLKVFLDKPFYKHKAKELRFLINKFKLVKVHVETKWFSSSYRIQIICRPFLKILAFYVALIFICKTFPFKIRIYSYKE